VVDVVGHVLFQGNSLDGRRTALKVLLLTVGLDVRLVRLRLERILLFIRSPALVRSWHEVGIWTGRQSR